MVLGLAWAVSVVWSYRTVRPARLSVAGKVVAGLTVTALCGVVCAPLAVAAAYAQASRDLLTTVFPDSTTSTASDSTTSASSKAATSEEPWAPHERLNVLLLGGDADPGRPGVRTDVMVLASIDPTTGRTVLLSIPRNLENAPLPFLEMRERFPEGFPAFLFNLWWYGDRNPQLVPGTERPGATLLTETIEKITGVPVDYYVLIDLDGFKMLIDALGGVWINVQEPIPTRGPFVLEPGYRKLSGREALVYARSRLGTSDYDRMRRQRCMLAALVNQAGPLKVLRNFRQLTHAAKRTVSTNIPRDLLPALVELAPKVKHATITNVQLVPPLIDTGDPNYAKIRRISRRVTGRAAPTAAPEDSLGAGEWPAKIPEPSPSMDAMPTTDSPSPDTSPSADASPNETTDAEAPRPFEEFPEDEPSDPVRLSEQAAPDAQPVPLRAVCPRVTEPR